MQNKRNLFILPSVIFQIALLIMFSFSIAFIFSEYVGSAVVNSAGELVTPRPAGSVANTGTGANSALASNTLSVSDTGQIFTTGADGTTIPFKSSLPEGSTFNFGGGTYNVGADGIPTLAGGGGTATSTATGLEGVFSGSTFGTGAGAGGVFSSLLTGAAWGAIVGVLAYFIADALGLDDPASIGLGFGGGTFAGTTAFYLAQHSLANAAATGGTSAFSGSITPGVFGLGVGLIVAVVIILATYTKQKRELVQFECLPWEAPRGGSNCDLCNDDPMKPCSEYRCKSLGQACEIVNKGSEEEMCVWVGKGDTAAPHIEPLESALMPLDIGLRYVPDVAVSPPNRGFKIIDSGGSDCLPAFTALEFGIVADEPAQCRIDYIETESYDDMSFLFGESTLFRETHIQRLKVPNSLDEGSGGIPEIGIDGTYTLWTRCVDANGNGVDSAMVAFTFCVDPGPDTTQPTIEGASIDSGSYVQFGVDAVEDIEIYINEPSNCRWSRQNKAYEAMENEMECLTETYQINADLNYVCKTDLTGIQDREDNWFYFRCEDLSTAPGGKNIMTTSFSLLLQGSEELTIDSVGPTGTFVGSTSVITLDLTAETSHGAEDGIAVCGISTTPEDSESFITMDSTGNFEHTQSLDLVAGDYVFSFLCVDLGGNAATSSTTFTIDIDTGVPSLTRVFKDGNNLKVITDEDAMCYYSTTNCNYNLEDGIAMGYEDVTRQDIHVTDWDDSITYYIKCADLQGNQPAGDQCQIIVSASEL